MDFSFDGARSSPVVRQRDRCATGQAGGMRMLALVPFLAAALLASTLGSKAVANAAEEAEIEATLCKELKDRQPVNPTDRFTKDAQAIHGYWKSTKGRAGMTVRTAWIAVDVGAAAPPNTKLSERTLQMDKGIIGRLATWWDGNFSLTRPTKGWPVGRYRAEIWFEDRLVKTLPFTIN